MLVDNGRSAMIGTEFQEMLRCIRCAACMNHCPVYGAVGGHAYGWVYPGPMGAVLTPGLIGVKQAGHLPNASTFCGKCESVCPVRIPLPKLMRHWREREFERHLTPASVRWNLGLVGILRAAAVALPAWRTRAAAVCLGWLGRKRGRFTRMPMASGWTDGARSAGAGRRYVLRPLCAGTTVAVADMSKDAMLTAIRRGLRRGALPEDQAAMLRGRLERHPRQLIPARSRLPHARTGRLCSSPMSRRNSARSPASSRPNEVPGAVADYLAAQNLPGIPGHGAASRNCGRSIGRRVRCWIFARGLRKAPTWSAFSTASPAIAETGTLMLPSARRNAPNVEYADRYLGRGAAGVPSGRRL